MKEVNRAQHVGRHAASDTRWTGACTKTPDWVYGNSGILNQDWFDNDKRLRALVSELEALSVATADQAEGWADKGSPLS